MKEFIIEYCFDGFGSAIVEAESVEEAEEKFFEGEFYDDVEDGQNYEISKVLVLETKKGEKNATKRKPRSKKV
jgi:hypothetical protein